MAGRIDHAAEAAKNLLVAGELMSEASFAVADTVALIAQAQATLALVEQQRIANRIAIANFSFADGSRGYIGTVQGAIFDYPESQHGTATLKPEIAEGLGL